MNITGLKQATKETLNKITARQIEGTPIKETEKAVAFDVMTGFAKGKTVWVPKSLLHSFDHGTFGIEYYVPYWFFKQLVF